MSVKLFSYIFLILVKITLLSGCDIQTSLSPINDTKDGLAATFSSIERNILRNRCALTGCHATDTRSAGMDLSTDKAYSNLVDVPAVLSAQGLDRVEPFSSNASFLIKVLDGSNPTKMPLNGTPLDGVTIDIIKQWIDEGAKNN